METLKCILTAGRIVGVALVLAMVVGCSRPMPFEEDFREMENALAMGHGYSSYSLCTRIAELPDEKDRMRCLERYRKMILEPETERADYSLIRNKACVRETLVDPWIDAAQRCGVSFSERMEFRIAFLEWLRAERKRIVGSVASPNDGRKPGLHITAGVYVNGLGGDHFLHMWRLELQFDEEAERECKLGELERLRARLEAFLGRPVRTQEKIMHDRQEFRRRNMEHFEKRLPKPLWWDC